MAAIYWAQLGFVNFDFLVLNGIVLVAYLTANETEPFEKWGKSFSNDGYYKTDFWRFLSKQVDQFYTLKLWRAHVLLKNKMEFQKEFLFWEKEYWYGIDKIWIIRLFKLNWDIFYWWL